MEVNKNYVHFAVRKSTGKIVNGWEQSEDIKFWSKIDLKDIFPDSKISEFNVLSKKYLLSKNINPFDWNNWEKHL